MWQESLRFLYVTQRYTAFIVPGTLSVYTEQSSDIHEKRDFAYHVPWLGDLVENWKKHLPFR